MARLFDVWVRVLTMAQVWVWVWVHGMSARHQKWEATDKRLVNHDEENECKVANCIFEHFSWKKLSYYLSKLESVAGANTASIGRGHLLTHHVIAGRSFHTALARCHGVQIDPVASSQGCRCIGPQKHLQWDRLRQKQIHRSVRNDSLLQLSQRGATPIPWFFFSQKRFSQLTLLECMYDMRRIVVCSISAITYTASSMS